MDQSNYWVNLTQRKLSRRRLLKAGLVAGAGLSISSALGCGSSTTATPTAGATGAQATPVPGQTAAAAKIQKGGTLRIAYGLDASSLDPYTGNSGGDAWYWYAMFDNLVAYNQQFALEPKASLAESWEIPDPTTMIFKLRKGVKFHDGTPFNAAAVKYNIERVQDPKLKATPRSNFLVIDRVDVVDDYTAKFLLKQPSGALLYLLGDRGGAMSSPTAVDKWGDQYGQHPVGTGPFMLSEWVKGSYVTMKRNPDYWGKDAAGNQLPYVDEVRMPLIPDSTVSLANLQTGDVELAGLLSKDLETVKRNKNLGIEDFAGGIVNLLAFNINKPPMDDVNLRLAVCYAVDPEAVNQAIYFGDYIVAKGGMWPPGFWVYQDVPSRPSYNVQKAKEYLAKAGKPNGFSMNMITYSSPTLQQSTEMFQAQLAEVGIKVTLDVKEVGACTTSFFVDQAYPIYSGSWSLYPEPDWISSLIYKSDGYYNAAKAKNDELDKLIAQGASSYNQDERKKIYNQINEIVLGQAIFVPLIYGRSHWGYNVKVQNMKTFYGGEAKGRYKELWLKQ